MTIIFLGLVGCLITPAFIREDLLLYHASVQFIGFAAFITVCFGINGIVLTRLFLGFIGKPVGICPASI